MRSRLLMIGLTVLFVALGYWIAPFIRHQLRPPTGTPSSPAVAPAPEARPADPDEQVQVVVSSADVPGCFDADQPLRAAVESRWGDKVATNNVVFRWHLAPDRPGGIEVRMDGQTMQSPLDPGAPFPPVTLTLPLGEVTRRVKLTTFVFSRLDETGKACFTLAHPPGTPRPYNLEPEINAASADHLQYTTPRRHNPTT